MKGNRMKRRIEVEREEGGGEVKGFGEKDTRVFFREWQQKL